MTKADLVAAIAKDTKMSKAQVERMLNSFTDRVTKVLKKGDKISLVGFGTFSVSKRKARKGRNPQTGETIKIKAAKLPKFKPGKALKDAVSK